MTEYISFLKRKHLQAAEHYSQYVYHAKDKKWLTVASMIPSHAIDDDN
jgi:hypothetical protein